MNTQDEARGAKTAVLTTLREILHNAVFAGAGHVEITTTADDYGGTVVVITDDGHGAADLNPFTAPGVSNWARRTAERPGGHALTDCLGEQRVEIASRFSPLDCGRSRRLGPRCAGDMEWTVDGASLVPGKPGTAIRFRTPQHRAATRRTAHEAALYMPIETVAVDGETAARASFVNEPAPSSRRTDRIRAAVGGVTISVQKEEQRPTHDACLYGIPIKLGVKSVPTEDGSHWTVRIDLSTRSGNRLRRDRERRDHLVEDADAEALRTAAYRVMLETLAENGETAGLPPEIAGDARTLRTGGPNTGRFA